MGSSKKKDRKKRRKQDYSSEEDDEYYYKKSRRKSDVPLTEENVYDYNGQEIKHNNINYDIPIPDSKKSSRAKRNELTPPPLPPGIDWPLEAPKASNHSPVSSSDYLKVQDEKNRDRDYQNEVDSKYKMKLKDEKRKSESATAESSRDDTLTIEETNKLRAKLGLKPLQFGLTSNEATEKSYEDRDDVHKPAEDLGAKKSSEKMREKMEALRDKRKVNQKLKKVRGLADDDDPMLNSAAAWVAKSRMQQKEKLMAEKRAKMLEEMDEEFGVSDIIHETVGRIRSETSYTSTHLKGLKVEHKGEAFQEEVTVLTLKDKGVLDEDEEDVLMNINIEEKEKAEKNVYNRKHKPGYKGYDEVDDETGMLKVKGVLDKYDEEIDGVKKSSFKIDATGSADMEGEMELQKIREALKAQQVSLDGKSLQLAKDFFTEEEMVKFKKPKKKIQKVVRKRKILKAQDLLKLDLDSTKDRGTRKTKDLSKNLSPEMEDMEITPIMPDELDYFVAVNQVEEIDAPVEEDEAEQELQLALKRSRRLKVKRENENTIEKIAENVLNKHKETEKDIQPSNKSKKKKGAIVLDSTSEFCRTLGDLPTLGPVKKEVEEPVEMEQVEDDVEDDRGGWEQVEINKKELKEEVNDDEEIDDDVLEPEPIPSGMAATLCLANMKGYLKNDAEKVRKFDPLNLPQTIAEVDVEKLRDEEKSKYSARGYDRGDRYDPYVFKEKANYKPNVKLEYCDAKGRSISQKEAFRILSHKFHGKGSGKLKTEKRANKLKDEKKLQLMSSIDTPLNTAQMFKDKQKASQSPFIVLSGGGKNLLSGGVLKK